VINKDNVEEYASVRSFLEWNPKASTGLDWRSRLASQVRQRRRWVDAVPI
jgi:hypothetical protein